MHSYTAIIFRPNKQSVVATSCVLFNPTQTKLPRIATLSVLDHSHTSGYPRYMVSTLIRITSNTRNDKYYEYDKYTEYGKYTENGKCAENSKCTILSKFTERG